MRRSSSGRHHHMLRDLVVPDGFRGQILAEAGMFEATVRRLRRQRDMIVYPARPELQISGEFHRTSNILGEHRSRKAVDDVVGESNRLILSAEGTQSETGAEDFARDDFRT